MVEGNGLEYLAQTPDAYQPVVGYSPVGKYVGKFRERREVYLPGVDTGVCRDECGYEHIGRGAVGLSYLCRERASGIGIVGHESAGRICGAGIACLDAARYHRYVVKELIESGAVVAVLGTRRAQGRAQGAVGLGVAAGACGWHVGIHELHLVGMVVGAVVGQLDFQAAHRLKVDIKVKLIGSRPYRRGGLVVVNHQPTALLGLGHIVLARESERKVETRRHGAIAAALSEHIADVGAEQRQ